MSSYIVIKSINHFGHNYLSDKKTKGITVSYVWIDLFFLLREVFIRV